MQTFLSLPNRHNKNSGASSAFFSGAHSTGGPSFFQARLEVGPVDDVYEREADAIADKVVDTQASETIQTKISSVDIQRKCAECEEEEKVQRKSMGETASSGISASVQEATQSGGEPLDQGTRSFMESRFGYDFSQVKIHTGSVAAKSAQSINAHAYTTGNHIVFNKGQYSPSTRSGQRLLAHELTHVVQQSNGMSSTIQRDCSNSDFCTPYPNATDAANAEWWIRNTYMRLEGYPTYGPEVADLYERFLSRRPGDSLAPVVFSSPGSYVVRAFNSSWDTKDDMDAVIDLVGSRLHRAPGGPLRDYTPTMMSLANFLSPSEMDNRPINYSNPFSVAGHIAGGIGSSAAGPDYRKITYANVTLERIPLVGGVGYTSVELTPHYEVFDAIDFCPGDCGSMLEQRITIPMSRLEASGEAYDQPFKVIFSPESRSKRFWF